MVREVKEQIFMGDWRPSLMISKKKVLLKLTSSKVLVFNDVLHISNICSNLVLVSLIGKVGYCLSQTR